MSPSLKNWKEDWLDMFSRGVSSGLAQSIERKHVNAETPGSIPGENIFARVMILGCGHVDTNDASCVVMQAWMMILASAAIC